MSHSYERWGPQVGLQEESIQDDIQLKAYHIFVLQVLHSTQSLRIRMPAYKFYFIQELDNEVNTNLYEQKVDIEYFEHFEHDMPPAPIPKQPHHTSPYLCLFN